MSVELLPDIENLDPDSLCYAIYSQLYHNFFNAQTKKSNENPYGIEEGDENSIRLRNTSYGFAEAIVTAVNSGSGSIEGETLLNYLKKSGGDMTGIFRANYGFEAGVGNISLLEAYRENSADGITTVYGLRTFGDFHIGSNNLFIGGKQLLRYEPVEGAAYLENKLLSFGESTLLSRGKMIFGEDKDTGVLISSDSIYVKGKQTYHFGNANLPKIDWTMKNSFVEGTLNVKGKTELSEELSALYGVRLGVGGKTILSAKANEILLDGFLSISANCGVKIGNVPVLFRLNETDVALGCDYGNLHLGSENTWKIKLFAPLTDIDGDNVLITKYGGAYFPDSLRIAHNYGAILLSTYRENENNEGIVLHKKMRLGFADGIYLTGNRTQLIIGNHNNQVEIGFRVSNSLIQFSGTDFQSLYFNTNCESIVFDKPVESKKHVGIDSSFTRMEDKKLFLSNEHFLLSGTDGIKLFGNAYFIDSLSSERFSSGFSGYGWGILKNQTTGNMAATFDEVTIRKKMRIYELEVQKNYATNGSLWITDSCSGDYVSKLL